MQERELALNIAQVLHNHKAQDVLVLKVGHLTVLTDYMVIATGNSVLQTKALADYVDQQMAAHKVQPSRVEGQNEGRWVVLDYNSVIVHIFHPEDRGFYRLERLWTDGQNRVDLPFEQELLPEDEVVRGEPLT